MTLDYGDFFSRFLSKITDYTFASLEEDDANSMMIGWMHSTLSIPYIRKIFKTFSFEDIVGVFTFELKHSIDEDMDKEFVTEILSKGMVICWLTPQVESTQNTLQMFAGKEQKFYSQSMHYGQLKTDLYDNKVALRKMIRDYGYINNSYISGKE